MSNRLQRIKRFMLTTIKVFFVAYLFIIVCVMFMENSLIFFPKVHPAGNWDEVRRQPSIEEVWITAEDGTKIHGLYAAHPKPRGVLLYFHGNAGNVADRLDRIHALHAQFQLTVLAIDYRGYGKSEGAPHEKGVLQDAAAATEWLADKEGLPKNRLIFLGRSLGGAIAVHMASRFGARGLVLESSFTSLPDVAARHYWWLPVRLLMRSQLNSRQKIGKYKGPVLQVHGTADRVVPFKNGQRLHEAIPGPKTFISFNGNQHNDPHPRSYDDDFEAFIAKLD